MDPKILKRLCYTLEPGTIVVIEGMGLIECMKRKQGRGLLARFVFPPEVKLTFHRDQEIVRHEDRGPRGALS